jgi:uncharacterized protein YdaU (DUF1376 family)
MLQVDHYLPLFGRDFLAATAGWTAEERGHYITLLIVQWEQGALPSGFDRLERVSPGVSAVWEILEPKFPEWDDGLRRNRRLEEHRAKAQELKEARSEAGKRGSEARWGRTGIANGSQTASQTASQTDGKRIAKGMAKGMAKPSPPTPTPNREEDNTRAHGSDPPLAEPKAAEGGKPPPAVIREPGWVHDEWARIVASWNATERAVPWTLATPPNGFADLAASPGWVQTALAGIGMLADCRRFARPVPWTQFVRDLDRIIAGEFREPLVERRDLAAAGGRGQRRGNL